MIRFVDLGDQICEEKREFAFFNTVPDLFVNLDQQEVFCCWHNFEGGWKFVNNPPHEIDRYKRLLASWVPERCEDCKPV